MNIPNGTRRRGRPGITQDDVDTIANQIVKEGKDPTNDLVRTRLGTGSSAKICECMNVWWATREINANAANCEISPSFIAATISEITNHVSAKSKKTEELRVELEKDRVVLIREVGELTEQLNLLEALNTKLETEVAEKNGVLFTVRENLNDAIKDQKEIGKEREKIALELAEVRATTRHMESMTTELQELKVRLASTEHLLSSSEALLAGANATNEQLQIAAAKAQAEAESIKLELAKVREATSARIERLLVELSDVRRQSGQHIPGLVNERVMPTQAQTGDIPEHPGQRANNLGNSLGQDKGSMQKDAGSMSPVGKRTLKHEILAATAEFLRPGPMTIYEIRDELERRRIRLAGAKNVRNLSQILSKSSSIQFDRQSGGWILVDERSTQEKFKTCDGKHPEFGAG